MTDHPALHDPLTCELCHAEGVTAELAGLRAENEALKRSWEIDANHRDDCYAALKAVWGDMRGVDKRFVPNEVVGLVRDAIGIELDKRDPAYRSPETDETEARDGLDS